MKIGFTGTRKGLTTYQQDMLITILESASNVTEGHHGDCVGADEEFASLFNRLCSGKLHSHPCNLTNQRAYTKASVTHEVKGPLDRNKEIVDSSDILIACPPTQEEQLRSGTWATIRYAKKIDIPIFLLFP